MTDFHFVDDQGTLIGLELSRPDLGQDGIEGDLLIVQQDEGTFVPNHRCRVFASAARPGKWVTCEPRPNGMRAKWLNSQS